MAVPAYINAGTGVVIASGSGACTLAGTTAGNLIILQVLRDGTASAVTLSAITNVENLAGTDNALTDLALLQPVGSPTAAAQSLYIGRSLGGTVSVTVATAGDDLFYRLYEFTGANTGTTLAAVTESVANGVGLSNIISDTGVTTSGADRLVCQFLAVNDDNVINAFTGATGGTWFEAVGEFSSATGTDGAIGLQLGFVPELDYLATGGTTSNFGNSTARAKAAQPFTAPRTETLSSILLNLIGTTAAPPTDDVTVRIETDAGGVPSGTLVGTQVTVDLVLLAGQVAFRGPVPVRAPVSAATKYWIVVGRTGAIDAVAYYSWHGTTPSTYADHLAYVHNGTSWVVDPAGFFTRQFALAGPIASGGTINGGVHNMIDSDSWGVVGLALIPPPSGPATLTRTAALNATGLILVLGRETLARLAVLNATGAVASSAIFWTTFQRAAAAAATGQIVAAGVRVAAPTVHQRTAAVAATGAVTLAGAATITDDFNRASIGPTWPVIAPGDNPLVVSGNALLSTVGVQQTGYHVTALGADQEASVSIVDFPSSFNLQGVNLFLRLQNPGTSGWSGYRCSFITDSTSGTTDYWSLQIITGGVAGSFPGFGQPSNYQDGDKVRVRVEGNLFTFERWRAGTWTELGTVSDSTYPAGGHIGIVHDDGGTVDDFAAAGAGVGGPYVIRPRAAAFAAAAAITSSGRETLARSAAVTAAASIASAGREQLARLAEVAAATNISVSGVRVAGGVTVQRSAALAATGGISTAGRETLARSAAVAASAGIATIGRELLPRAAVVTAAASIATVGQRRRLRSAAVSAAAAVTAAGETEGLIARAAALAATAAITTSGEVEGAAERAAQVAATGTLAATGTVIHVRARAAALTATGAVTTAQRRTLQRTATVSTTSQVAVTGRLTLSRTSAVEAVAAITTVAGGNIGQASLTAISTITVTLPLPAGAIGTSTTGHLWHARRGGIHVGGNGEIASSGAGMLARTGG